MIRVGRVPPIVAAAIIFAWFAVFASVSRADEAADLQQQMEGLRTQVQHIDAELIETQKQEEDLKRGLDAYAANLAANEADGKRLTEWGERLTVLKRQVDAEHAAGMELCHRPTATAEEYSAVVADCKKAGEAYQTHVNAARADYDGYTAAFAKYDEAHKKLETEHADLDRNGAAIRTKQADLLAQREEAAKKFTALGDRLTALQALSPQQPQPAKPQ